MASRIRLDLRQPPHGWMTVTLTAEGVNLEFAASYTPWDSIADLAQAVSALLSGVPDQAVCWNTEPVQYQFRFMATGGHTRLEIYQFPDHRRHAGVAVAVIQEETTALCRALWRGLRRLQGAQTESQYEAAWGRPFPSEVVQRLSEQLKPRP